MGILNAKVLQLTHNDLDGIGCGVIGKMVGVGYHIVCTYSNIDNKLEELRDAVENGITKTVYITDLSMSETQLIWLDKFISKHKNHVKFYFFDHHTKSTENKNKLVSGGLLENKDKFVIVEGISATELFANMCSNLNYNTKDFSLYVTAWDLQKSEHSDGIYYDYFSLASDINKVCRALPIFTAINKLHNILMNGCDVKDILNQLPIEAKYIVDSENAKTKGLIENVFKYINSGAYNYSKSLPGYDHLEEVLHKFLAGYNPEYDIDDDMNMVMVLPSLDYKITDVATAVFETYQSINIVVEIAFLGDRITYNLRSRKHTVYNVCELAGMLDVKGGGHVHAAGASITFGK